jgi:hypothetical protein
MTPKDFCIVDKYSTIELYPHPLFLSLDSYFVIARLKIPNYVCKNLLNWNNSYYGLHCILQYDIENLTSSTCECDLI